MRVISSVEVQVLKPREKDYMDFDEALINLRTKCRDSFEDWLLVKIDSQLEGVGDGI